MVTPAARREAVVHLRAAHGVIQRRACAVLAVDRSSVRYRPRTAEDAAVRARMHELAAERRRFGYRRLHWLIGREGMVMNHKKFRRLYREERLQVRGRSGRKRARAFRARHGRGLCDRCARRPQLHPIEPLECGKNVVPYGPQADQQRDQNRRP